MAGNANFLRAGRLLLSSRYWTEPVRLLANAAAQLLGLRNEAVAWLINPHHNRNKRADAVKRLDSLMAELAAGGPRCRFTTRMLETGTTRWGPWAKPLR